MLTKIVQIYDTITKGVTRVLSNGAKNLLTKTLCIFKLLVPLLEDYKLLPDDGTRNLIQTQKTLYAHKKNNFVAKLN